MQCKLTFDRKRSVIGLILAAISLVLCTGYGSLRAGSIFAVLFVVTGCIRIRTTEKKWKLVLNFLWMAGAVFLICTICPRMLGANMLTQLPVRIALMNYLCALVILAFFFVLSGNIRVSTVLSLTLIFLIGILNAFVYQFRGRELSITDIFSAGTALNVANQYHFVPNKEMIYCIIGFALVIFSLFSFPGTGRLHPLFARGAALLVLAAGIMVLNFGTTDLFPRSWRIHGSNKNGFCLNVYLEIRDSRIDKPEGYSPETVSQISGRYPFDNNAEHTGPNILVIMNESFASFDVYPHPPVLNRTETPFLDSLDADTVRGYALSSVFGGNTANTEFEFLTGHSMGGLPANVIPYQQYIHGDFYSLAWYLRSQGYQTMGTHPFYKNGWSRDRRYPELGFQTSSFIEDYPGKNMIREYISDQEMFAYMLDCLRSREEDAPMFLFGVTMQNHGGYTYGGGDFQEEIQVENADFPQASQYLSLVYETDHAMEYLLTELSKFDEDTIVLFFGDHQPAVEPEFLEMLNGGPFETLEQKMCRYQVPFYIWANFDIPEETVSCTSVNYLAARLLEAAGMELPAYYQFQQEIEKTIPAMNSQGYYSVEQGRFVPYSQAEGKEAEALNEYFTVQYNNLFDHKNADETFFSGYVHKNSR